jgi:transposase
LNRSSIALPLATEKPDRAAQHIQVLALLHGLELGTATVLSREVFCRLFRNRQALAGFVGLTGTPFNSGGSERDQGISKHGNPRVRRLLLQLACPRLRDDALRLSGRDGETAQPNPETCLERRSCWQTGWKRYGLKVFPPKPEDRA